jgi:hypothetical protein
MNASSQKQFDELMNKDLKELSKEDKDFLVARRAYMNPVQKEIYKDILPQEAKSEAKKVEDKK